MTQIDEEPTIDDVKRKLVKDKRAAAYRKRRDAQNGEERRDEQRKQRIANGAFLARKTQEQGAVFAAMKADYQRARRANETVAERATRKWDNEDHQRRFREKRKREAGKM